jgi:glutamine synthetase
MLPCSLEAATARMMQPGSIAREVFGDEFVEHYGGTREHEVRLWNQAVTNWEGKGDVMHEMDFADCLLVERYLELA